MAAELKNRNGLGVEMGLVDDIVRRFKAIEEEREFLNNYRKELNSLFSEKAVKNRHIAGLWTCETVRETNKKPPQMRLLL